MTITKEHFFKPGRASGEEKTLTADQVVKQIVSAEAAQRLRKTEHLRQLREAQETARIVQPPVRGKKASAVK
ncbi:hypothetical protein M8R20_15010 [Pseudomonas sp. R2.Fl]|nr:hypothetical protein [Pseudomonas sp. R2.Fl]